MNVWNVIATTPVTSLVFAKVNQAHYANKKRQVEDVFKVGDFVMLRTLNRRRDYTQAGDGRAAELMPWWGGKYKIVATYPDHLHRPTHRANAPISMPPSPSVSLLTTKNSSLSENASHRGPLSWRRIWKNGLSTRL